MANLKELSNKYVLTFGAVSINVYGKYSSPELTTRLDPNKFQEDLIDTLKKSPQITNIKIHPKIKNAIFTQSRGDNEKTPILIYPIQFECNLPKNSESLLTLFFLNLDIPIDTDLKFSMLYNGFIFAYYRPITNPETYIGGNIEAKDQLTSILKQRFDILHDFPTPLRQDFIVDTTPNSDVNGEQILKTSNNKIEIKTEEGITDIDFFVSRMFLRIHSGLEYFYRMTRIHTEIRNLSDEMNTITTQILNVRQDILKHTFLNIYKNYQISNSLKMLIQNYFKNYTEVSELLKTLEVEKANFQRQLAEPLLSIYDILLRDTELKELPINSQLSIIELAQNDVKEYNNNLTVWITIFFSLISAIIGGIIGALLV
jgi:hypothetical protein